MVVMRLVAVLCVLGSVASLPQTQVEMTKLFDSRLDTVKYKDCHHLHEAGYRYPGTFEIWINEEYPLKVHCENSLNASATVIQRREYGDFSFHQKFVSYQNGFGNMPPRRGDFWIGLNSINYLTSIAGNTVLSVVIQDWNSAISQATYHGFKVEGLSQNYRMHIGPRVKGDLFDDLYANNGMMFATYDKPDVNMCAIHQQTGWWFNYCTEALPNGHYFIGGKYQPVGGWYTGIYWKDWKGYDYSAKFISLSVSH